MNWVIHLIAAIGAVSSLPLLKIFKILLSSLMTLTYSICILLLELYVALFFARLLDTSLDIYLILSWYWVETLLDIYSLLYLLLNLNRPNIISSAREGTLKDEQVHRLLRSSLPGPSHSLVDFPRNRRRDGPGQSCRYRWWSWWKWCRSFWSSHAPGASPGRYRRAPVKRMMWCTALLKKVHVLYCAVILFLLSAEVVLRCPQELMIEDCRRCIVFWRAFLEFSNGFIFNFYDLSFYIFIMWIVTNARL